jgi:hypothetical protein
MSKKFLKLPQSPGTGRYFVFSSANWAKIESKEVYGHELPRLVRDLLALACLSLTLRLPREKSAPRLNSKNKRHKSVLTRIEELKSCAEALRSELFSSDEYCRHPTSLSRKLALELALLEEAADTGSDSEVDEFSMLKFALNAVIGSTEQVLAKSNNKDYQVFRDGESWQCWVSLLTLILKTHGLEYGTRREIPLKGEKKFSPQPFVRLVGYLQTCVLQNERISQPHGGLAKAIDRARAATDVSHVDCKNVPEFVATVFGVSLIPQQRGYISDMQHVINLVLHGREFGLHSAKHSDLPEVIWSDDESEDNV